MKKYLTTGLIVLLPTIVTLSLILFVINFFTTPLLPFVSVILHSFETSLHFQIPNILEPTIIRSIALILVMLLILFLGLIANRLIFRTLIQKTHNLLLSIPFVKTIFKVTHDLSSALFSLGSGKGFRGPVVFTFPNHPNRAIGFVVGEVPKEIQKKVDRPLVPIFSPTAPHPISGFLLFVDAQDVQRLDMSNEEAIKFMISCGIIVPEEKQDLQD